MEMLLLLCDPDSDCSFLKERQQPLKRSIFGYLVAESSPQRCNTDKHYVSIEDYYEESFPTYIAGGAYAISGKRFY